MQVACSPACALKVAKRNIKEKEKAERKDLRERKQKLKTISQLKSEAQSAFNRFIRLRDHNDGCISCGRSKQEVESDSPTVGGYWDAGHYKTRGAYPQLRYVEANVHKQCKKCNGGAKYSRKEKTVTERYRENLIKKIGADSVEWLEQDHPIIKWTREDLEQLKKTYNARANKLQKLIGDK